MKNFFSSVFSSIVGNILTLALVIGSFVVLILISSIGSIFSTSDKVSKNSVLEITLDDAVLESSMEATDGLFDFEGKSNQYYLKDYLNAIELAKEDDKIKGISLKLGTFKGGITQLQDLRKAMVDFKKSGKFVYSYSNYLNQSAYYLPTAADSMYHNPMGEVALKGLSAEVMFYKNMGDKYGVDFQVIRHGEYKSAVEPFLRDNLSDENRYQITTFLNDIWEQLSNNIITERKIPKEDFTQIVDSLYSINSDLALKNNLFDQLVHESEYDQLIANKINLEVDDNKDFYKQYNRHTVGLNQYLNNQDFGSEKNKIAVLYASGLIAQGDGFEGIQSETYKKAIRKLKDNKKVKAVVLRINSGGGSANASEEILHELKQLHKTKPIIVSFGDIAASGGYYIAMESDSIFAQPTTITGSIGVLGMVPNIKKLINNVGITTDYVNTNANSNFLNSPFQPLTQSAKKQITNSVESIYEKFVKHVAKARNMTFEQTDSIARGRVWSGKQAKQIGLVDAFGNLNDAIKAAATKAKLKEGDYSVISQPIKKDGLQAFLEKYQVNTLEAGLKKELGTDGYFLYQQIKTLKNSQGIQMRMPFDLTIN